MREAPGQAAPWPKALQAFACPLLQHGPTEQAAGLAMHTVLSAAEAGSRRPLAPQRGKEGVLLCKLQTRTLS